MTMLLQCLPDEHVSASPASLSVSSYFGPAISILGLCLRVQVTNLSNTRRLSVSLVTDGTFRVSCRMSIFFFKLWREKGKQTAR